MMQRYLGWSIGDCSRADFPHEAHDLVITDAERELVQYTTVGDCANPTRLGRIAAATDTHPLDQDAAGLEGESNDEEVWQY